MARQKTKPVKGRVLTPTEIELSDQLQKALTKKADADVMRREAQKEISRLTNAVNKLGFSRATVVWAEAHAGIGAPAAPTRQDLMRK